MLPQFVPLFYSDNFTVYAVEQIICKCAIFKTLYLLNSTCVFDMIFSDISISNGASHLFRYVQNLYILQEYPPNRLHCSQLYCIVVFQEPN